MRHAKAVLLHRIALDMESLAGGVSLEEIRTRYTDRPLGRRTAERMRDAIAALLPQMEEVPSAERVKRWRLPRGGLSRLAGCTAAELAALGAAAALLRAENRPEEAARLDMLGAKLRAALPPRQGAAVDTDLAAQMESEGLIHRPGPRQTIRPEILAALREAILACRKIRIHYRYRGSGKQGYETVRPYGILYGHRHYLVAWSENERARDFRTYALGNIERIDPLDAVFARRKTFSLQAYAERSFGVFQEKPVNVVWRFKPEVAEAASEYVFHPKQRTKREKDGSLTVRFRAGGVQEMAWYLVRWGSGVRVLKPEILDRLSPRITRCGKIDC